MQSISRADRSTTVLALADKFGILGALQAEVTEFAVNQPRYHWTENAVGWSEAENSVLTLDALHGFSTALAVFCQKKLDRDCPIASLTLPGGERCQIVLPPVAEQGTVVMTIRKPSVSRFSLAQYASTGRLSPALTTLTDSIEPWEQQLLDLSKAGNFEEFFRLCVAHRLNIVTVGGTGSGKTTFSKTLIDLYPLTRRIFTLENAHELTTPLHRNSVHLFFSDAFPAKLVLENCMRHKPDHIFITELRGDETWPYLMALKSGHQGSVTSIHANDCRGAFYKMASYVKQSDVGRTLDFDYILREVMSTIDVVVYFEKTHLKELYFDPAHKRRLLMGGAL